MRIDSEYHEEHFSLDVETNRIMDPDEEHPDEGRSSPGISLSEEKISAIASGLLSNSTEISQYIQDNKEFYQEFLDNPEHELEPPINPIHVLDL